MNLIRADELPIGHFRTILADPPWAYDCTAPPERLIPVVAAGAHTASATYYYPTLSCQALAEIPVAQWATPDACLFLWATVPLLPEAFSIMDAWGFQYKTMLTWHKTNGTRLGYWFRGQTEHVLVGIRGHVPAFRSMRSNLIMGKRGRHSAKPEQVYEMIEEVCQPPYLELFARRARHGWTVFGNDVEYDLLS